MLEVLVAILILSFGVLGAAGMQIAALQANKEARYQANAARLGAQLVDLMRANASIASRNAAATAPANVFLFDIASTAVPTAYTDNCLTAACDSTTPVVAARFDVQRWINQLSDPASGLPGWRVVVCFDDAPFDAANKPQWPCNTTTVSPRTYVKIGWTSAQINATATSAAASAAFDLATVPKLILDASF